MVLQRRRSHSFYYLKKWESLIYLSIHTFHWFTTLCLVVMYYAPFCAFNFIMFQFISILNILEPLLCLLISCNDFTCLSYHNFVSSDLCLFPKSTISRTAKVSLFCVVWPSASSLSLIYNCRHKIRVIVKIILIPLILRRRRLSMRFFFT